MNKIYLTAVINHDGSVRGLAIADTGLILVEVLEKSTFWALYRMGIDSEMSHDIYESYYPNGYELEIVENFENHKGIRLAFQRVFRQFQLNHGVFALEQANL